MDLKLPADVPLDSYSRTRARRVLEDLKTLRTDEARLSRIARAIDAGYHDGHEDGYAAHDDETALCECGHASEQHIENVACEVGTSADRCPCTAFRPKAEQEAR